MTRSPIQAAAAAGTALIHQARAGSSGIWTVQEGPETRGLLDHVFRDRPDPAARTSIVDASSHILQRCVDPHQPGHPQTGLVIGYVQSGKTLSFTTVAALARDNGYHLVIVLTGISNPLYEQSRGRIRSDLRLDERRERRWTMFANPQASQHLRAIRDILSDWRDPAVHMNQRATALIAVMKNHTHLRKLRELLRQLDLSQSPVLVIDDEADQASMNTRVQQGEESTTYRRIGEVRQELPHHTFLQYTATPQAPLLINLIDALSPSFVQVLEPGHGYVGGHEFFEERYNTHVRAIPENELQADPEEDDAPPESLLEALRVFFIGVAAGHATNATSGNRSMLVHPSHRRERHRVYLNWVNHVRTQWEQILVRPSSAAAAEILEDFRTAYEDVRQTEPGIPSFEEISAALPRAIRRTRVMEVNSPPRGGRTPNVPWNDEYAWILVAGQAVDRGFTVEGLTVTYMPRGVGIGHADTLQQRGRFFGYKRTYLGYCRIYLSADVRTAFRDYVHHEEDIRNQLQEYQAPGLTLNDWKRAFILSPRLRPTRQNVLQLDYMRGLLSNDWVSPHYPLGTPDVQEANRWLVSNFLDSLEFLPNDGHPARRPAQRHSVAEDVRLETVLQDLLVPLRVPASTDSQRHTGLMLQLRRALDRNPDELCTVYRMSQSEERGRRTLPEDGRLPNLFQGAYPVEPRSQRGSIYPGDREIHHANRVTVQIHMLDLRGEHGAELAESRVPVVATWVPARLAAGWIVQDEDA